VAFLIIITIISRHSPMSYGTGIYNSLDTSLDRTRGWITAECSDQSWWAYRATGDHRAVHGRYGLTSFRKISQVLANGGIHKINRR